MSATQTEVPTHDAPRDRAGRLTGWVWVVALVQLAALVATSSRYGYHRDEMYFIAAGAHPAFGYPDQPPLVPLLSWTMNHLAPGSVSVLRLPSALAAVVITVLAAEIAREIGGDRRAQIIAACSAGASGIVLATGHIVSTTTYDVLATTVVGLLLIRAVRRTSGPALLWAGVAAGIGCEAKPQVAFVSVIALVMLAIVGPRWPFGSWWLTGAVVAATVIAGPYVIWQVVHGWPQLTVASHVAGSAEGGRIGFIPFQIVMVSPWLAPVWVAGLLLPWRRTAYRSLRFLPLTYAVAGLAYLAGDGKAYYLASLYPVLLGLGALPVAEWTRRARARLRTSLLVAATALSIVINVFIALPLLPVEQLQGSLAMAINPDLGETVGWPQFVATVALAWRSIPFATREHSVIFTQNYGEAGAIDLLGPKRGLPRAYSGQNAFAEWGHPGHGATHVLLLGYDGPSDIPTAFTDCRRLATIDNGYGLDNDEQGGPVLLCRSTSDWATMWPRLRHYN